MISSNAMSSGPRPLSSTAIVLQTLAEKGLVKSDAGQNAFSVLLFQDIAVIPMLAILPLLGTRQAHSEEHRTVVETWMSSLPAWAELPVLSQLSLSSILGVIHASHIAFQ